MQYEVCLIPKPELLTLYISGTRSNRLRQTTQRKLGYCYEPWLLSRVHPHAILGHFCGSLSLIQDIFTATDTMLFLKSCT